MAPTSSPDGTRPAIGLTPLTPVGPGVALGVTVRSWPGRRWVAAALALPVLLWAYWAVTGAAATPGGVAALGGTGILAALILASYVPGPGTGRMIEIGCSPCAVMAAATVLGSFLVRANSPGDTGAALVGLAVLLFGLMQRLSDARSCAVGPRTTTSDHERPERATSAP